MPTAFSEANVSRGETTRESVSTVLQLEWNAKDRLMTIVPQDNDKFISSINEAIEACKAYKEQVRFGKQYELLMKFILPGWINSHQGKIAQAIVTMRESRLLFLVVRNERAYDPEFESAMIDLDISIARNSDLSLLKIDVLDLPSCDESTLESFLDCDFTLWYKHAR